MNRINIRHFTILKESFLRAIQFPSPIHCDCQVDISFLPDLQFLVIEHLLQLIRPFSRIEPRTTICGRANRIDAVDNSSAYKNIS